MRIIKNINSATACALYNKGVDTLRAVLDSLTKISGKNHFFSSYVCVEYRRMKPVFGKGLF